MSAETEVETRQVLVVRAFEIEGNGLIGVFLYHLIQQISHGLTLLALHGKP